MSIHHEPLFRTDSTKQVPRDFEDLLSEQLPHSLAELRNFPFLLLALEIQKVEAPFPKEKSLPWYLKTLGNLSCPSLGQILEAVLPELHAQLLVLEQMLQP